MDLKYTRKTNNKNMKKTGFNYSHYDCDMSPEGKDYSERISKGFRLFKMSRDGYPGD